MRDWLQFKVISMYCLSLILCRNIREEFVVAALSIFRIHLQLKEGIKIAEFNCECYFYVMYAVFYIIRLDKIVQNEQCEC